jgi:outer membrane protein
VSPISTARHCRRTLFCCRLPALLLAGAVALSGGLPAAAATLAEIAEMARAADPLFAAARATALAGQEKRVQGRAGLLPQVTLSGTLRDRREFGALARDTVVSGTPRTLTLNASVPVIRRASLDAYRQGEQQSELAQLQLRVAENDLLLRVSRAYFEVLQAQEVLASMGAQRAALAQQLTHARRGHETGMLPVTDFNDAQARHDLAVAQQIAARNDVELKRRALQKVIVREVPPLAGLDAQQEVAIHTEAQLRDWLERAPDDAPQVAAARKAEEVARTELARQQAGHYPTVDLVASASYNSDSLAVTANQTRQAAIGLELSVPIFQGGMTDSRIREAAANLERAQQDLANARAQARLDAGQAYLGVLSGQALQTALRQAKASGELQVRSTTRGAEVGTRTRSDVLNAVQQLHATLKELANTRYQVLLAGLQLKSTVGVLDDADLRGLDALLVAPPR